MEHIGIDVAKVNSQICVLADGGELIERRIRTTRDSFRDFFASRAPAMVLIESCGESEWIARWLEGFGHKVIVADPGYRIMYGSRGAGVKTDRRDARALAEAARVGAYRTAHRMTEPQRRVRRRIVVRDALVRSRAHYIVLIQALLRQDGFRVRTGVAESIAERVAELELPGHLISAVAPLLAVIRGLDVQIEYSDKQIELLADADERARNLRSVPGVGPLTAVTFVNAIDDVRRFENGHKVAAYLGLVPREFSSGERQRRGSLTKAGNPRVRSLLVQAAIRIRRIKDSRAERLWQWADALADRRGKRKAAVALARRLAGVLFALMRDNRRYCESAVAPAAA